MDPEGEGELEQATERPPGRGPGVGWVEELAGTHLGSEGGRCPVPADGFLLGALAVLLGGLWTARASGVASEEPDLGAQQGGPTPVCTSPARAAQGTSPALGPGHHVGGDLSPVFGAACAGPGVGGAQPLLAEAGR